VTFHFDCIFYYVKNLDRSICFYRDVLGFQFVTAFHAWDQAFR
jgi:catechol 2,3-dioxygenase-like lactoylglutathione lyase family enzyme